ncbi:MAG: hypothetical protein ACI868_000483 [Granulosicoccus sp.]
MVFLDRLDRLVALDGRVDFIEWVTLTLIQLRLRPTLAAANRKLDGNIQHYHRALTTIFNSLVELSRDKAAAEKAHQAICRQLDIAYRPNQTLQSIGYQGLGSALMALEQVNFVWRRTLLQAFGDIIQADGRVEFREYELLRIMAQCLACPMPPLRPIPVNTSIR